MSSWLSFTEADRLLTMMPLFHMNAVSVTTMSALYAGGSTVVSLKFSASRFWQIISDYQITSFGSVATMLSMLLSTYPDGVPPGLKTDQLRFEIGRASCRERVKSSVGAVWVRERMKSGGGEMRAGA